jgi:lysozyme family protein
MSFEKSLPHTLQFEGGYSNDPEDGGGETFRGISRRANPQWPGWPIIDAAKQAGIRTAATIDRHYANNSVMYDLVAALYHRKYYLPVTRFQAPEQATDKMFDAGVNIGPGGAIRLAQGVIGVRADGVIGPKTLAAVQEYFSRPGAAEDFLAAFCRAQEAFYRAIVARKPAQAKFLNGWLNRAAWLPK